MATRSGLSRGGYRGSFTAELRNSKGELIARDFTIDMPELPKCINSKCLWDFMIQCLTTALIQGYHHKRLVYATKNRNKKILERYRTGSPSPQNLWQAIHANIKLRCPICRKYNADPLLFGGINDGTESNSHQ